LESAWAQPAALVILALLALDALPPRGAGRLVEFLGLLAFLAAAAWSGWRAAGALVPQTELASRTVCALTCAVAAVTGSATLLGHLGALRLAPFFGLVGGGFVASLWLRPTPQVLRTGYVHPGGVAPLGKWRWLAGCERALLFAAAAALALRLGGSLVHVVLDPAAFVSYDDLSYHLPAVAVWHQSGDLRTLKFEIGDPSPTFYPFTSELCSWALLAPLRDSDLLARRVELVFAAGSLIAVVALSRRLGLGRRAALLAALLYATVDRAFPALALGAGNDHTTAFFTLASLDSGLQLLEKPGRRVAAYAGAALGLLIGTKYIGLLFAVTVIAALVAIWASGASATTPEATGIAPLATRAGAWRHRGTVLVWRLAILGVAIVLCGGYAYLRNALTAGNPIFPAPVALLGHPLLPGWTAASLQWRRQLPEFQIDTVAFLTQRADLFGPLFVWTMLPAALLAPAVALVRRQRRLAMVLALPVVLFCEFRFLMHDHRDVRYILSALAIGAIAAAWGLCLAMPGPRAGGLVRCCVLLGILLAATAHLRVSAFQQALLLPVLLVLAALTAAAVERHRLAAPHGVAPPRHWPRLAAVLLGLAALSTAVAGSHWTERFQAEELAGDADAAALQRATGGIAARVAYVGSNEPYNFFGSRLQNDVEIVPTDGDLAAQYYAFGGSVHFPFGTPSAVQWRANLQARRIQFVVAARGRTAGPERSWMAAAPEDFALLYQSARVEIWRLRTN
jgi:hypothetical protein